MQEKLAAKITTPDEALQLVKKLKENHDLYLEVQKRGYEKGKQHDEESVCRQWEAVLAGPVTEAFEKWRSAGRTIFFFRGVNRQLQKPLTVITRRLFYLRAKGLRGFRKGLKRRLGMPEANADA